jgi:superfamily I DNA/RNA helicase
MVHRWLNGYIDKTYDMIMIDETQDFDAIMLQMLLNDTTIPKLFVGDPKQSIYQWRGCINAFNHLPAKSLIVEFYSTFRIGDPACEMIRKKFRDCWMISKSNHPTTLTHDLDTIIDKNYTYLFRSWRRLLTTARTMPKVWICNYEQQIEKIRKLHPVISKFGIPEEEFEDDLPSFLKSMSKEALEELISEIEENVVSKEEATCKFYTIHAYKGLEDDHVRIANDIDTEDSNLYYVALTRGMQIIVEDIEKAEPLPLKKQLDFTKYKHEGENKSRGIIYKWLNRK